MTTIPVSSNITNSNSTGELDYYCTDMPAGAGVWCAVSVLCGCVGLPASVWLLWVLIQRQRSGMTNDVFMLNLTAMDLIFNAFVIPGLLNYFLWRNHIYSLFNNFLFNLNMIGRPLFMMCICVDCFMAVVYPITYMNMKRSRYRLISCMVVWGLTLCSGILSIFVEHVATFTTFRTTLYFLAIPTIVICDLAVLYTLRKPDPSGRSGVHPQKQRAQQTITNSLVMTLVSYLPIMVGSPFWSSVPVSELVNKCVLGVLLGVAPVLGGTVMPLLQLQSFGRLRGLQCCFGVSGSPGQLTQ